MTCGPRISIWVFLKGRMGMVGIVGRMGRAGRVGRGHRHLGRLLPPSLVYHLEGR